MGLAFRSQHWFSDGPSLWRDSRWNLWSCRVCFEFLLGREGLGFGGHHHVPDLIVVIWLYGMIAAAGYGLNMVTVAIAAMSLGVGIDYVIHVVERYREEREKGVLYIHLSLQWAAHRVWHWLAPQSQM